MPTFNSNILPSTTGLTLGGSNQRWNAYVEDLNAQGATTLTPVTGQSITPGGAIHVLTSPVTVSANTTDFQSLTTFTVPAGLLNAVGKVIRIALGGLFTTQVGQNPQVTMEVRLGGIVIMGATTFALPADVSGYVWRVTGDSIVYTHGSAAFLDRSNVMVVRVNSLVMDLEQSAVGPVDLTSAQTFEVRCSFSTNTAPANTCTLRHLIVEVLN